MTLKIEFPLPFKLPIEDGVEIVSSYEIVDLKMTFKQEKNIYKVELDDNEKLYEHTIVMAYYSPNINLRKKENFSEYLRSAVVNCIEYLNNFIDALRFVLNDREISNFTITDLPEVINILYQNESYGYATSPIKTIKNRDEAGEKEICDALNIISTWEKHPEFAIVDKFFDKAKFHLAKEEFIFSIIELQTSFETFIRNTHRLILIKKEVSEEEIAKASEIPFRNVIEQHLAKALKVQLDFKKNSYIKNWYDNLYTLRNQIVHCGRTKVSGNMSYKAYDAYVEARNYISDLLVNEGYLNDDGKIDLKLFIKNTRESVDDKIVCQRLIKKGLIRADAKVFED